MTSTETLLVNLIPVLCAGFAWVALWVLVLVWRTRSQADQIKRLDAKLAEHLRHHTDTVGDYVQVEHLPDDWQPEGKP